MATAHRIGRLYIVLRCPQAGGSPLIDRAHTIERDGALRRGNGFLIRAPFTGEHPTVGVCIGLWRKEA